MDNNKALQNKHLNRQIYVQRKNLVQICRFTVKSLIDKASLSNVDDDCEELINFCAVLEQLMSHRLKAAKAWFTIDEEQKHFWGFIKAACQRVPNNCINSIANLENVRSPLAKGRAWIRCVLMEKRLSEYLSAALQQTNLIRKFYREGAVMLSEDANMLCGVLLGLNAIDFSFCLKGNNVGLSSPVEIDFTPYLRFQQSRESQHLDQEELQELNTNFGMTSSIMNEVATVAAEATEVEDSWKNKFKAQELKYKAVSEQKGYLEELGRLRDQQLFESQRQRQILLKTLQQVQEENKRERQQLEGVILELQKQITVMKQQHTNQQQKYNILISKLQGGNIDMDDVGALKLPPHQLGGTSNELSAIPPSAARLATPVQPPSDTDTQSMIAMAGSFTSQGSLLTSPELGRKLPQTSEKTQGSSTTSPITQDEEYVIVPEHNSDTDHVINTESVCDQSEDTSHSNLSNETPDNTEQKTPDDLSEISSEPPHEVPRIMVESSEEEVIRKEDDGSSGNSDDIMILSDSSLHDNGDEEEKSTTDS